MDSCPVNPTSSLVKPCATCRLRKVKCDRKAPACSQCTRSRWTCPGYQSRWRFRNTNENIGNRTRTHRAGPNRAQDSPYQNTKEIQPCYPTPRRSITSSAESLRANFVAKLTDATLAACFSALPLHPYLKDVAPRIGASAALDSAVRCVCQLTHRHAIDYNLKDDILARISYITALRELQGALNDSDKAYAPETLAAALLLQMHELHHNAEGAEWMCHTSGVLRLMEFRGPDLFQGELELAMLEAELGHIYFACLRQSKPCFLLDAAWAPVFSRLEVSNAGKLGRRSRLELTGSQILLELPGIIGDYVRWQQMQRVASNTEALESATYNLLTRTASVRQRLFHWRKLFRVSMSGNSASRQVDVAAETSMKFTQMPNTKQQCFEWAMICSAATCAVMVNHITMQLLGTTEWLREIGITSVIVAAVAPLRLSEEKNALIDQSLESAETANLAYTLFEQHHPHGAKQFRNSMVETWARATFWCSHGIVPLEDTILKTVGPMWPTNEQ